MPFDPPAVTLHEAGPDAPYEWTMTDPLVWTGGFGGAERRLRVPPPFTTDLASVPRSLTWLFPRYGKYTKAAVLHDYLCQHFRSAAGGGDSLLPLEDRSDADEVFRHVMAELEVPWLRRWLMWAAVSWATLFTALVPGRRSHPVAKWAGRIIALAAVIGAVFLVATQHDRTAAVTAVLGIPAGLLVAGTIGLARADRVSDAVVIYAITLAFSPLLALGAVLAVALFTYLALEDLVRGLPAVRGFVRDLFSEEAKQAKVGTPQFARLAAVLES